MPISGIFNMFSSLANNSFNAAEAAKNRRWQEQMYDKQYTDNVNLWQMQQEYNSPENQVARLKAAGINPSLAMSQISTGSATSAPAAAQAGSGAQATGTPAHFAGLTEGVLNLLKSKDERNLLKEQANSLRSSGLRDRIDAIVNYEESASRIIERLSGANKAEAERMLTNSMRRTEEELRGYKRQEYIDQHFESVFNNISQIQSIQAFPELNRLALAEKCAILACYKDQRNLDAEEYRKKVYETVLTEAKAAHAHLDYKTAKSIADDIIEQTEWFTKYQPVGDVLNSIFGTANAAQGWMPVGKKPRVKTVHQRRFGNRNSGSTYTEYNYE